MKIKSHFKIKRFLFLFITLILLLVVIRIVYVNVTAEKPIEENYSQNEWVELGGSYFRSYSEDTNGYSVMIYDYKIYYKGEYYKKYNIENPSPNEANSFHYIMELRMKIKNENNNNGKIQIGDWCLIGGNNDYISYLDQQLLMDSDDRINSIISSITSSKGKEIEINLPFPMTFIDGEKYVNNNFPYKLAVTKYPARKYIYINNQ